MSVFTISINQLSEYISASDARKRTIVKQQLNPSSLVVPWYKSARTAMKKCIENGFSKSFIISGIEKLQKSKQESDFQKNNVRASIEALNIFLKIHFPDHIEKMKCTFLKADNKILHIEGVDIKVAPDVIIRTKVNGKSVVGGIKFRLSKGHGFEMLNCLCAATAMKLFLQKHVANSDEVVDPAFCLSVDVFSERVVPAPKDTLQYEQILAEACKEITLNLKLPTA